MIEQAPKIDKKVLNDVLMGIAETRWITRWIVQTRWIVETRLIASLQGTGNGNKTEHTKQIARACWHDYRGGVYFVTICTKNREHYFGKITQSGNAMDCTNTMNCTNAMDCRDAINRVSTGTGTGTGTETAMPEPQMQLSPIGQYAHEQFVNVTSHYPYAEIPLFVVMPNHIHAIVMIDGNTDADARCSDDANCTNAVDCGDAMDCENAVDCGDAMDCENAVDCRDAINRVSTGGGITGNNNPMLQKCLGTVIRGLKARITRYANENNVIFAWQTRFHDRIVRDQHELNRIAHYIENNVANWHLDELNKTT